jgi:hypothetical protein
VDGDLRLALTELQRLKDHDEIRRLMYRYARGVDRSDLSLLRSVYHDGGTDHHGHFDGPGAEFASRLVERDTAVGTAVGDHHITNILIELDGDEAHVETYFLAFHPHRDNGSTELGVISGRYLDVLEKRAGRWGIRRREVISDWTRNHVSGSPWRHTTPAEGGYIAGQRGTSDASYRFFAQDVR